MDDSLAERIVKRKLSAVDWTKNGAIIVVSGLIVYLFFKIMPPAIAPIFGAAVAFFADYTVRNSFLEFEYILADGKIVINKIIAKRKRKPYLTIENSSIEVIAPDNEIELKKYGADQVKRKVDVTSEKEAKGRYFILYTEKAKGERVILFFEPDILIMRAMKKNYSSKFISGEHK